MHDAVLQPVYTKTWDIMLYFDMYIFNITTPSSTREMGNYLNQLLGYKASKTASLKSQLQRKKSLDKPFAI